MLPPATPLSEQDRKDTKLVTLCAPMFEDLVRMPGGWNNPPLSIRYSRKEYEKSRKRSQSNARRRQEEGSPAASPCTSPPQGQPVPVEYHLIYQQEPYRLSLCRSFDLELIRWRVQTLLDPIRCQPFDAKYVQKLVITAAERPSWRDVHLAAYYDIEAFFTRKDFFRQQGLMRTNPELVTPLMLMMIANSTKVLDVVERKYLTRKDPKKPYDQETLNIVNSPDAEGDTLLHYVVQLGKGKLLQRILTWDRELINEMRRARNRLGQTAIHALMASKTAKTVSNLKIAMAANVFTVRDLTWPWEHCPLDFLDGLNDQTPVQFTNNAILSLNLTLIGKGGCPLHWAIGPAVISKMIDAGFHIDTPDREGNSPLLVMLQSGRMVNVTTCLYNNADVNKANAKGETPFMQIIKDGHTELIKFFIVFGAQVNPVFGRESPVHLAALGGHSKMVELLKQAGARACDPVTPNCTALCQLAPPSVNVDKLVSHFNFSHLHEERVEELLNENNRTPLPRRPQTMMLTVDGGGVCGLFTIQLMLHLEKYLPRPLDHYFTWYGGTSTGAIIAAALTLGISVKRLRALYLLLKDTVMVGLKPYKAGKLVEIFKRELSGDEALKDLFERTGNYFNAYACRSSIKPLELMHFAGYRLPAEKEPPLEHPLYAFPLWKTLRASSAAPVFFQPLGELVDGGLIANNPTYDTINAFLKYQKAVAEYQRQKKDSASEAKEVVVKKKSLNREKSIREALIASGRYQRPPASTKNSKPTESKDGRLTVKADVHFPQTSVNSSAFHTPAEGSTYTTPFTTPPDQPSPYLTPLDGYTPERRESPSPSSKAPSPSPESSSPVSETSQQSAQPISLAGSGQTSPKGFRSRLKTLKETENDTSDSDVSSIGDSSSDLALVLSLGNLQQIPQPKDNRFYVDKNMHRHSSTNRLLRAFFCNHCLSSACPTLGCRNGKPWCAKHFLLMLTEFGKICTTSNEHIDARSDTWCASLGTLFFRLVPRFGEDYEMDNVKDEHLIEAFWEVHLWLRVNDAKIQTLAKLLERLQTRAEQMEEEEAKNQEKQATKQGNGAGVAYRTDRKSTVHRRFGRKVKRVVKAAKFAKGVRGTVLKTGHTVDGEADLLTTITDKVTTMTSKGTKTGAPLASGCIIA